MLKYKILIKLYVLSCLLICFVCGDTIQVERVGLCLLIALVLTHNVGIFTSIKTSSLVLYFNGTILCETKNMISGYKGTLWLESLSNTGVVTH